MKIFKSFVTALLFLFLVNAQTNAQFMVLGAKGDNKVNGQPLKIGTLLQTGQTITVGNSAYLGLAHTSKKTIELKKAGTYKISDLEKQIANASNDLTDRYASFVINELTNGDGNTSRFNRSAKTGSVTRDVNKKPLLFAMPVDENGVSKTSKVLADTRITIGWFINKPEEVNEEKITSYRFIVKDGTPDNIGNIIFETTTSDKKLTIDLAEKRFKHNRTLLYQVEAISNSGKKFVSPEAMLKKLGSKENYLVSQELKELPQEETAINKLIKAKFFEEKGLIANAINMYEEAITMTDVPQYRSYYNEFLNFYGLTKTQETTSSTED